MVLHSQINCGVNDHRRPDSQPESENVGRTSANTHVQNPVPAARCRVSCVSITRSTQRLCTSVVSGAVTVDDAHAGVIRPTAACSHSAPAAFPLLHAVPCPALSSRPVSQAGGTSGGSARCSSKLPSCRGCKALARGGCQLSTRGPRVSKPPLLG